MSVADGQYTTIFLLFLFASAFAAWGLNWLLFQKDPKPHISSDLATPYLSASIFCDVIYLALTFKAATPTKTSKLVLLRCCIYVVLLALERRTRIASFGVPNSHQSPEDIYGVLDRVLFTWINPLILRGYKSLFVSEELPPLSQDLKPELTRRAILQTWAQRGKSQIPMLKYTCF